jgi:hypothetical protein
MLHGKLYYLGKGRGISDRESYNRAVSEWKRISRLAQPASEPRNHALPPVVTTDPSPSVAGRQMSVRQAAERFLEAKEREARAGEISVGRVDVLRSPLAMLVQKFGERELRSIGISQTDAMRDHLLGLKSQGRLKSSTANLYFIAFTGFLRWCWRKDLLTSLPRNIGSLPFTGIPKDAKPKRYFSTQELQDIYRECLAIHREEVEAGKESEGRDLLTTSFLLGLNCGYTQSDISDLRVGELTLKTKVPRIERRRSKTQVKSNHLLWRKTAAALQGWVEGKGLNDRVFHQRDGSPIPSRKTDGSTHDPIGKRFGRVIQRLFGKDDPRRFRELRRTSANRCAQRKGQGVAEWFLAHTDKHVSSHYIERPQRHLDVMLAFLEKDYGFEERLNRVVVRRKSKPSK